MKLKELNKKAVYGVLASALILTGVPAVTYAANTTTTQTQEKQDKKSGDEKGTDEKSTDEKPGGPDFGGKPGGKMHGGHHGGRVMSDEMLEDLLSQIKDSDQKAAVKKKAAALKKAQEAEQKAHEEFEKALSDAGVSMKKKTTPAEGGQGA